MVSFFSPYAHDFVRVAAAVPRVNVADPAFNGAETLKLIERAHAERVALMVFPELGLSSYAIDDLLQQDALLDAVEEELRRLVEASRDLFPAFAVGLPLRVRGQLFNCAALVHRGRILGLVPKSYLPNYREFYEKRHFAPGAHTRGETVRLCGMDVPFGVDLLFCSVGTCAFTVHIEICEDVWAPLPPSTFAAMAGAEVLLNLSASNITIGKSESRHLLCGAQSMTAVAAYVYAAAGPGESTTDLAWDGQAMIYENGGLLGESDRFAPESTLTVSDVDLGRLRQERMRTGSFGDCARANRASAPVWRTVEFTLDAPKEALPLCRDVERFPYVPSNPAKLAENCYEAFNIQVQGLAKRLEATRTEKVVIGVSGGLDSTHALMVIARAFDRLKLPRENILAFTMPGFATGDTSKSYAWGLMKAVGATAEEIDIRPAAKQLLADMKHPFARGEPVHDVTFENVQAGLRTDYLFRLANHHKGLVVGTGDLSEIGLGWSTYGVGDHMSHYNVNASVPKTLIQHLIRFVADSGDVSHETAQLLREVLGATISPELVPAREGEPIQSTEAAIGPYPLQDFNLYYTSRFGFRPSKTAYLSWNAWSETGTANQRSLGNLQAEHGAYSLAEVRKWLELFLFRFFTISQFKRSAMPNGPKISSGGSLSPRGDWRAPSDSAAGPWLEELKKVPEQE
ncbi:NAD(+) synthase [Mesorhizobium sp. RP14(2022)]|uniref:Glutamine-dependent NAD(+) synthetase n=1 Tax=Mesorhizobium liriopis TaxID=2953882 RepID=A0ABT1C2Q3_9HYPH|nr:NAD(+) synthase [Mesorhizobium liriopis]MCO6049094.1 NAD(+) synthase [Mesorhizobium liriopis]